MSSEVIALFQGRYAGDAETRARPLSVNAQAGSSVLEPSRPDYVEISSIPPLPLYALLAADDNPSFSESTHVSAYLFMWRRADDDVGAKSRQTHVIDEYFGVTGNPETAKSPTAVATDTDYSALFSGGLQDDDDDDEPDLFYSSGEFDARSPATPGGERRRRKSSQSGGAGQNYFGPSQAALLVNQLTHTHLPGLSSLDQMYMLALADTVANTKLDFSEKSAPDVAVKQGQYSVCIMLAVVGVFCSNLRLQMHG